MPVTSANSAETPSATGSEISASWMPWDAEDPDRIGAEPDEGRMAERHQRAVADQQVERERRDREDHHAGDEAQHIGFGPERREQRHEREDEKDRDRQRVAGEDRAREPA